MGRAVFPLLCLLAGCNQLPTLGATTTSSGAASGVNNGSGSGAAAAASGSSSSSSGTTGTSSSGGGAGRCSSSAECPSGQVCDTGVTFSCQIPCIVNQPDAGNVAFDADCPSGEACNALSGYCATAGGACDPGNRDSDCNEDGGFVCGTDGSGNSVCFAGCDSKVLCPSGYYCDLYEGLCSDAAQPPALGPNPNLHAKTPTKYPIVLVHGFDASSSDTYSTALFDALVDDGHTVFRGNTSPFETVAIRAPQLLAEIQQDLALADAGKVNLICHSMGGLDCRYLASAGGLDAGGLIASITTLGTPHQGSPAADAMLDILEGASVVSLGASDNLASTFAAQSGLQLDSQGAISNLEGALTDISVANAPTFNANTPDNPLVYYQSYAGVATYNGIVDSTIQSDCQGLLLNPNVTGTLEDYYYAYEPIVGGVTDDTPNDGLVPEPSAIWGTFLGCNPCDHGGLTGISHSTDTNFIQAPNSVTGWDPIRFFRNVAYALADMGY